MASERGATLFMKGDDLMTLLAPYRVLDLTDERALLAGFLLAQLGAEVVVVEAPAPAGMPRTLAEEAYNRGKRSVTLDLRSSDDDRRTLRELVKGFDVLLTVGGPAELATLGIDDAELARINPRLVRVAISAFGQSGPKADYAATDLIALAAGDLLWLTGDDDRPPVRPAVPQGFANPAADAAGAALIALWERDASGLGQRIDVSAQASLLQTTQCMVLAEALGDKPAVRSAGGYRLNGMDIRLVWPCKDGLVTVTFLFGGAVGPFTTRLMKWIDEEGMLDEDLRSKDWIRFSAQVVEGVETLETYEQIKANLGRFLMTKTKAELLEAALDRRLVIAPITSIEDVANSSQLADRQYWEDVDGQRFCGSMAKFSETPLPALGPAPARGAHTAEILADLTSVVDRVPAVTIHSPDPSKALAGMKVLDFTWAMAGPGATRVLADFGATVIRVETSHKPEAGRYLQPFVNGVIDTENSGVFLNMNVGKLGLSLDLNHPGAKEIVFDLVRWADIVCETFTPGTMHKWGLGFEALREVKPDIIMFSSALMGQTGPLANFAGYGNLSASICGFYNITGWPDREPTGPYIAYTDYVAPRFTLAVMMAALDHRRRTGQGQFIDFSHAEASMHLLAPAFVDWYRNGHVMIRQGNRDDTMAPHGVYPCTGNDRWIAIAVDSDESWTALCEVAGFGADLAALDTAARLARSDALDELVAGWTADKDRDGLEAKLQERRIPAHGVHASSDSLADAQLAHRGHFVTTDHQIHGPITVEGTRWLFSRTPPAGYRAAPVLGQDTFDVLTDHAGYDPEKIAELLGNGVLE